MAFLCAVVILGGKSPLVVEVTSSIDDVDGLFVPIPTCACAKAAVHSSKIKKTFFFMLVVLFF